MRFQKDTTAIKQGAEWTFRGFVEPAKSGDEGHKLRWRH